MTGPRKRIWLRLTSLLLLLLVGYGTYRAIRPDPNMRKVKQLQVQMALRKPRRGRPTSVRPRAARCATPWVNCPSRNETPSRPNGKNRCRPTWNDTLRCRPKKRRGTSMSRLTVKKKCANSLRAWAARASVALAVVARRASEDLGDVKRVLQKTGINGVVRCSIVQLRNSGR